MSDLWDQINEALDTDPLAVRDIASGLIRRAEQAEAERDKVQADLEAYTTDVLSVLAKKNVALERAEAALERVRAVHQPKTAKRVQPCDTHESQIVCSRCEVIDVTVCSHPGCHGWPCKTIAALNDPKETP